MNSSDKNADQAAMRPAASVPDGWAAPTPATAPFGRLHDAWTGLSRDLIERFIEVACFQRSLSRSARRGYRSDLAALDNWMQRTRERTLASARSSELRIYLDQRIEAGLEARLLRRLLASLHHFYKYLHETGCRNDNPARRLLQETSTYERGGAQIRLANR